MFVGEKGSNIAGGFVAHPTAKLDSNKINFADWGGVDGDSKTTVINKDNTDTDPLLYGVASVVNDGPAGNFIHGLATVDGKGFNFVGTPFASATVTGDVLYLGTDRTSGVAFSRVSTGAKILCWAIAHHRSGCADYCQKPQRNLGRTIYAKLEWRSVCELQFQNAGYL